MAYNLDQSFTDAPNGDWSVRVASNDNVKVAQSFQVSLTGPINRVELFLSKAGSPTGNIWVTLEADSSGDPSNSALATSDNVDVSTLTGTRTYTAFDFSTPYTPTPATTYWIVLQGDYTFSAVNYALWGVLTTGGYGSGETKDSDDGSTWNAGAGWDAQFKQYSDDPASAGFFFMSY